MMKREGSNQTVEILVSAATIIVGDDISIRSFESALCQIQFLVLEKVEVMP